MKIEKLEIIAFGKFQNVTFDFSEKNQLFFGENEAGKSTLFAYIETILFGFEKRIASRRDYTSKTSTKTGGRLTFSIQGESYTIERFREVKKGKAELILPDGKRQGEAELTRFLFPLNRELFQGIYCFSQESLRNIHQIDEQQLNRQLISLGLSGSEKLMDMQRNEVAKAEMLFKPRGTTTILNKQLEEYDNVNQKISALRMTQDSFSKIEAGLEQNKAQRQKFETSLLEIEEKLQTLQFQLTERKVQAKHLEEEGKNGDVDVLGYKAFQELMQEKIYDKGQLSGKKESIERELDTLERLHPALTNPQRKAASQPSKLGVISLVVSIFLSIVCFMLLEGSGKFFAISLLLVVGLALFLFIGLTNQRHSYTNARRKWNQLLDELNAVDEEMREKDQDIDRLKVEEKRYLSNKKQVVGLENSASVDLNDETMKKMEAEIEEKQVRFASIQSELQQLHLRRQELNFEKSKLEKDGSLEECLQEREVLKEALMENVKSYLLSMGKSQFIDHLLREMTVIQLPDLLREASSVFEILTNGAYHQVRFEEKIVVEAEDGEVFDFINLSLGTRDQLIMSLRFAFLRLQKHIISPMIIDDGWLNYDAKRKEAFANLLHQGSDKGQIILFSSDERMKEYYQTLGERVFEIEREES